MKEIEIVFSTDRSIISWFIRKITKSDYSHVDIVLPKTHNPFNDFNNEYLLGSVPNKGVIIHKETYSIEKRVYFRLTDQQYKIFFQTLENQYNKKYDWIGVIIWPFAKWFRRDWDSKNKWFCSELIAHAFYNINIKIPSEKPNRISPGDLERYLTDY